MGVIVVGGIRIVKILLLRLISGSIFGPLFGTRFLTWRCRLRLTLSPLNSSLNVRCGNGIRILTVSRLFTSGSLMTLTCLLMFGLLPGLIVPSNSLMVRGTRAPLSGRPKSRRRIPFGGLIARTWWVKTLPRVGPRVQTILVPPIVVVCRLLGVIPNSSMVSVGRLRMFLIRLLRFRSRFQKNLLMKILLVNLLSILLIPLLLRMVRKRV